MKWNRLFAIAIAVQLTWTAGAGAQEAGAAAQQRNATAQPGANAAVGDEYAYPDGVTVRKTAVGRIFVDAQGKTLYALSAREARARQKQALTYCVDECTKLWIILAAPETAKATGWWKPAQSSSGQVWTYHGNPVFTYVQDKEPGSMVGNGYDDLWNVIAYIPPVPKIIAPATVTPLFVDDDYVLADQKGHALYTNRNNAACGISCENQIPLNAGMASQGMGEWTVLRDGDRAQWAYRGKPVYVSQLEKSAQLPETAAILRP